MEEYFRSPPTLSAEPANFTRLVKVEPFVTILRSPIESRVTVRTDLPGLPIIGSVSLAPVSPPGRFMNNFMLNLRSFARRQHVSSRVLVTSLCAAIWLVSHSGCATVQERFAAHEETSPKDHLKTADVAIPASMAGDLDEHDHFSLLSVDRESEAPPADLESASLKSPIEKESVEEIRTAKADHQDGSEPPPTDLITLVADEESISNSEQTTAPADLETKTGVKEKFDLDLASLQSTTADSLQLLDIVRSVHESYPALEILYLERQIASGNQLAAWGAFDTKLKGASENQPTGFYETYRQRAEIYQPIYHGGDVFGGYRIGRGEFEPWYQERETNEGGEFKLGMRVPLLRNREIDARRAELWRATYEQQRVQPEIRTNLINFVRDASYAYWIWVAAGQQVKVYEAALELSNMRNDKLQRRLETGDIDPPIFQDNVRSLRLRESKLIDRQRKLDQSAVKLSLYYRSPEGDPLLPAPLLLPGTIPTDDDQAENLESDLQMALASRPEIEVLNAEMRKIDVDYAEARNDLLPDLDTQVQGKQDVGGATSSKRDKSEFELEAGIYVEVPLQRRKARGKIMTSSAKLAQLRIKREFTEDKIIAEVQSAYAGVKAAEQRIGKAVEARELAEYIADVERRKFDLGESDLLAVFLREQYAIEAADAEIEARLEYQLALADYLAALADDLLP
ncbi:MAG: transporter [Planctomyces sp.]|nr:transporter [Planctomyces sp.]